MFFSDVIRSIQFNSTIMATPTTLNIGEPADEQSVDGNTVPLGDFSSYGKQIGDHERLFEDNVQSVPEIFVEEALSPDKPEMDMESHIDSIEYDEDVDDDSVTCPIENKKSYSFNIIPDSLITPYAVCFKIVPAVGAVSYGYFSLSVVDPKWFSRAFGEMYRLVGNTLWFQAHLGAGLYIYSRRHIRNLPIKRGILYCVFGSVLFNFGSCMIWGLGRSLLKSSPIARAAFGITSSCLLLYAGQDYLQYVDDKFSELD